jgi:hypothetical protein
LSGFRLHPGAGGRRDRAALFDRKSDCWKGREIKTNDLTLFFLLR